MLILWLHVHLLMVVLFEACSHVCIASAPTVVVSIMNFEAMRGMMWSGCAIQYHGFIRSGTLPLMLAMPNWKVSMKACCSISRLAPSAFCFRILIGG